MLLAVFAYLSQITHWADSELWTVSIARQFGSDAMDAGSRYKIIFEYLLSLLYRFDLSDEGTMGAARVLFMVNGLGILALTAVLARRILGGWSPAIHAVFLLVSSSFFLSQGFRVRSDLLACLFALAGLWAFFRYTEAGAQNRTRFFWIGLSALFHLAAFLSTPKAIYHILLNAVFIYAFQEKRIGAAGKKTWLAAALIFILSLATVTWVYSDSLGYALKFFVNSFFKDLSRPDYLSVDAFRYLLRFVNENLTFFVLILATPFLAWRRRQRGEKTSPAVFAAMTALFLILFHNDRLPFFILSLLPLPAIAGVWSIQPWLRSPPVWLRAYLAFVIFLGALSYAKRVAQWDSNLEQRVAMHTVREFLAPYPGVVYFDATAALPRTTMILQNVEITGHDSWGPIRETLIGKNVEILFFGNRLFYHTQNIFAFLEQQDFIHVGGGVYAKGKFKVFLKPPSDGEIENLCAGIPPGERHLYLGRAIGGTHPIESASELKNMPEMSPVGCAKYPPVQFPGGQSFAQIFDYDQDY
jgi:hypothetical protein